ncbi:MAG: hypothetical protein GWN62_07130, partial [Aliifodinibius sp.]|nr:hypothetical protein [Fodinibius sp.]
LLEGYESSADKGSIIKSVKANIHKINGAAAMLGFGETPEDDKPGNNHGIYVLTKHMSEYLDLVVDNDTELG